jgi:hypothetical protein
MKYKTLGLVLSLLLAVPSVHAQPQQPPPKSDLLIRVQGPVTINANDSVGTVWVINNDVNVMGSVEQLIVVNGRAQISGTVKQSVFLLRSSGTLAPTAHVGGDVLLYRSTMNGSAGSVSGKIRQETGASFAPQGLWLLWASITLALIVAGLVFGYFFGDSLGSVADQVRTGWRGIFLVTVALICGLPLLAVLSFMTGIGFVLGFFILFAVIPALSLLGFLVAGTSLGRSLLQVPQFSRDKLFGSIAIGIVVLQLLAIVPAIGVVSVLLGSWFGAGALVYRAWLHEKHAELRLVAQAA